MNKSIKIFIFSLIFLNLLNWISVVEFVYGIPQVVKYFFSATVLIVLIYYRFSNPLKPQCGSAFYGITIFFVTWSLILLILAFQRFNSIFYIQRLFGQRYFFIPYLLPLLLLFSKFNLAFFKKFFYYSFLFIIPAILMQMVIITSLSVQNLHENLHRIWIFDIGSSFLLLTAHISKKRSVSIFILLYIVLMLILSVLWGRRGMLIEYLLLIIFMIIIRIRSPFIRATSRMKIFLSILAFAFFLIMFGSLFESTFVFQRGFTLEAFNESRGLVIEDFLIDFSSTSNWIFGRGIDGSILRTIDINSGSETLIENGFLTIILKGGLLYLIPFIIIFLRAIYLGFFSSRNDLAKSLATILLIHLIIMFTFNLPDYSSKYIFVWVAVSACFNPGIRNITNEELAEAFNS